MLVGFIIWEEAITETLSLRARSGSFWIFLILVFGLSTRYSRMANKCLNSSNSDWELGNAWSVEKDCEAVLYQKQGLDGLVIFCKGWGRGEYHFRNTSKNTVMHQLLQICLVSGRMQIGRFLKEKHEKHTLCLTCPFLFCYFFIRKKPCWRSILQHQLPANIFGSVGWRTRPFISK